MRDPAPADKREQEGDGAIGVSAYITGCRVIFLRSPDSHVFSVSETQRRAAAPPFVPDFPGIRH